MEHDLLAYRCTDCEIEFAVVVLNGAQWNKEDANPGCPKCNEDEAVTSIDCVILKLADRGVEYVLGKSVKPLEK